MSLYAISDLHLSFDEDKPMDIFGTNWENHQEKIRENWKKTVKENDVVLLPGDFCWSMYLQDTYKAFNYLETLPGKKLLLKGNHDYWWSTVTSMRNYLKENNFKTIDFIYNNAYEYEDYIICGTRGWTITDYDEENKKILNREIQRLKLSLEYAKNNFNLQEKKIIVCMHYPPIKGETISEFINVMKEYNVQTCLYGHLHGNAHKDVIEGEIQGINIKMVSCDYTNFELIKL